MNRINIVQHITGRDSDIYRRYLVEVTNLSKDGNLTKSEEKILFNRYKNGDESAKTELIHRNLRFVISVANKFQHCGLPIQDLVNEGNIGLIRAINKFDPDKDIKLISYAVWNIYQSISFFVDENSRTIRIPKRQLEKIKKINKFKTDREKEYSITPTIDELSKELELEVDDILFLDGIVKYVSSLDDVINKSDDSRSTYADFLTDKNSISSDNILEKTELSHEIKNILSDLTDNERNILELYYGFNNDIALSMNEISKKLDLTITVVKNTKDIAIKKLKRKNSVKILKEYI